MGFLDGAQMSKEELLHGDTEQNGEEDSHVCQDHQTGIALRKVDARRVEVWPLLERSENHRRGQRRAECTVCSETHHRHKVHLGEYTAFHQLKTVTVECSRRIIQPEVCFGRGRCNNATATKPEHGHAPVRTEIYQSG